MVNQTLQTNIVKVSRAFIAVYRSDPISSKNLGNYRTSNPKKKKGKGRVVVLFWNCCINIFFKSTHLKLIQELDPLVIFKKEKKKNSF